MWCRFWPLRVDLVLVSMDKPELPCVSATALDTTFSFAGGIHSLLGSAIKDSFERQRTKPATCPLFTHQDLGLDITTAFSPARLCAACRVVLLSETSAQC